MGLDALVASVRNACGSNVLAIVLYGSAAGRDYHGKGSDRNVLLVLENGGASSLRALAPALREWATSGEPPPLVMTRDEWLQRADVFAIEYADLLERHRVLYGELQVDGVQVRPQDLRAQLESEVMGKLLRLRRGIIQSGSDGAQLRSLLEESVSSVLALLRGVVHMHGESALTATAAVCDRAAALAGFDAAPLHRVLAHRAERARIGDADLDAVIAGYLIMLERMLVYVDAFQVS
jgi:hypothetical protein